MRACILGEPFFAHKVLLSFNDDVILQFDIDFLTL
jgi:hypothetical protein